MIETATPPSLIICAVLSLTDKVADIAEFADQQAFNTNISSTPTAIIRKGIIVFITL